MSFFKEKPLLHLLSPRFLIIIYCLTSIVLDFYFKYNPDLPPSHLLTGTSPILEVVVILAVLAGSYRWNKVAYFICSLDVILGFVCLLTLPVISTAENATGHHLHLPLVSTFHSTWEFHVTNPEDLLYVTIMFGFFSTFLILLFLCLDLLKLMLLIRLCRHDQKMTDKINVEAQNPGILKY